MYINYCIVIRVKSIVFAVSIQLCDQSALAIIRMLWAKFGEEVLDVFSIFDYNAHWVRVSTLNKRVAEVTVAKTVRSFALHAEGLVFASRPRQTLAV